ncbi:kinesin-like protein KIF13B isoform X1 [Carcharodon carcharias]|uniref:kinesin-like protein KIF13B isoform X1 n=1 Tax=Carcharodon carcharias TaxID=13397 RepID=UPI001B7E2AF5|nr:kinesin-like protein KIF13B isoform X1 [Carcharodon carcharias]
MSESNVKVAVRIRPLNRREIDLNTKCVIDVEGNQTILSPANANLGKGDARSQPKVFAYDHCFWSMDESVKEKYAGQDIVFKCLGESLLQNAFQGYNACIFAYGQTGSGKSYTMMGSKDKPGLIPRLCSKLFERALQDANEEQSFTVEVSFMEIYNEKVRDLLDPKGSRHTLKVREHKVLGPYVDGLSKLAVTSYKDIESLMSEGNKSRTVAATNMNEESSRSHAVFNIILTHTLYDLQSGTSGEKVSKLSLVDLAGSERAAKSGAAGDRLKEGSNINKSLTTLGLVISALADQAAGKNKNKFVPYRDSVLTWLLKDSLGGNSKTAMIATVSPAADNYDETLSTLRYADRAKNIINHAVVNEDPNARIIRELREEVDKLREQLSRAEAMKAPELKDRLEESEKLIQEMTVTWEDKLRKTEAIAQERQKQLERLGISLQSSGIKVGDDKCFLVNLNADPALNELLVYYLKNHTLVGSDDSQDIQLCGMGILPEHCIIDISPERRVTLTPRQNSRTFVNGSLLTSPVQLHHGDRILWGNNHFFRINLPKTRPKTAQDDDGQESLMKQSSSSEQLDGDGDSVSEGSSESNYSYEFAQMEVTMKALGNNDAMQSVLQRLERQHEEEKRSALEQQRLMYERELEQLRRRLSPEKHYRSMERLSFGSPSTQQRLRQWTEEREAMLNHSLMKLQEQIAKANHYVHEANYIAEEMEKKTEYQVTLQIPASSLDANRKRDSILSEPAIQVRRKNKGKQIWPLEKLENRLIDMRELYQEWKDCDEDNPMMRSYFKRADPFFDEQENHSLIGVANVFLELLFYDVKLQYAVPIINQKGEVAGRLHVEVVRMSGDLSDRIAGGEDTLDSPNESEMQEREMTRKIVCRIKILQATGLPRHLSNFVFCQYTFWDQTEPIIVAPEVDPSSLTPAGKDPECMVVFDHCKEFSVNLSEDLLEYLSEGALAFQVYGHKSRDSRKNTSIWDLGIIQAKTRSLRDRWSEVMRKIELWIQILELNENGEYVPVEVTLSKDVSTGGIFQLRQGQSRRIQVEVRSVQDSGTLPLIAEAVLSIAVGCVKTRPARTQKYQDTHLEEEDDMDSYQERDLEKLRRKWLTALTKRQEYLDKQLQKLAGKSNKSEDDADREAQLLERRLTLTEERNAVMVPSAGSGIPGSPAKWSPAAGMETHVPVVFLDLNADDFSSREDLDGPEPGALDASLVDEDDDDIFELQIAKHHDPEVKAEASWDSNVHNCSSLSKGTPADERVFLIVKAVVQLSHPAEMQLVLRKRICVNVYSRQGFAQNFLRRMSYKSTLNACGVTFEIVSNIPEDAQASEDRETLARMAAELENAESAEKEAYIEKYLRSVLAVENILTLDRLRQEVAVKEQLNAKRKLTRRCISSPNVNRLSGSRHELNARSSLERDKSRWESQQDISTAVLQSNKKTPPYRSPVSRHSMPQDADSFSALAASYLNPVKAFVPQMPKLLKSLFPARDEEKRRSAPPQNLQSVPRILVQPDNLEDAAEQNKVAHKEKVPSASLMMIKPTHPAVTGSETRTAPSKNESVDTTSHETQGEPQSPSSEASSGYFSHSVSTATLSETNMVLSGEVGTSPSNWATPDRDTPAQLQNQRILSCESSTQLDAGTKSGSCLARPAANGSLDVRHQINQVKSGASHMSSEDAHQFQLQTPSKDTGKDCESLRNRSPNSEVTAEFGHETMAAEAMEKSASGDIKNSFSTSQTTEWPLNKTDGIDVSNQTSTLHSLQIDRLKDLSPIQKATSALSASKPEPTSDATQPKTAASNPFKIQKVRTSELKSFTGILGDENVWQGSEDSLEDKEAQCPTEQWDSGASGLAVLEAGDDSERSVTVSTKVDDDHELSSEKLEIISDSEEAVDIVPEWLKEGEYVSVGTNKTGTVRYIGPTEFADGIWIGIELSVPAGKNDGSVGGKQYFRCNPGYGVLVRLNRVAKATSSVKRRSTGLRIQSAATSENRRSGNFSRSNPNLSALTALAKSEGGAGLRSGDRTPRKSEHRKSWSAEQKPS